VVTAGIDSQDTGFYVVYRAWGARGKTHILDSFFLPVPVQLSTHEHLAKIFKRDIHDRVYRDEEGNPWSAALVAIDTGGHRTLEIYKAASECKKFLLIKGRNTQDTTITYHPKHNLYLVRTDEYRAETELMMSQPNFTIYSGVDSDFLRQYTNVRKIRATRKTTGENIIRWMKVNQDDYRMADIHALICLDVLTHEQGTMRYRLEEDSWSYNPLKQVVISKEVATRQVTDDGEITYDDDEQYKIGEIQW
jgi:hypothetical protein